MSVRERSGRSGNRKGAGSKARRLERRAVQRRTEGRCRGAWERLLGLVELKIEAKTTTDQVRVIKKEGIRLQQWLRNRANARRKYADGTFSWQKWNSNKKQRARDHEAGRPAASAVGTSGDKAVKRRTGTNRAVKRKAEAKARRDEERISTRLEMMYEYATRQ